MTNRTGIGRFAADLPATSHGIHTLGEGDTPLLTFDRLASELGVEQLAGKMESANPTGSYADRVAAMSVTLALDHGCRGWIMTSSGNAALSMAHYGTRAGLVGKAYLDGSTPPEKLVPLKEHGLDLQLVDELGENAVSQRDLIWLYEDIRTTADRERLFLATADHMFNAEGMRALDTIGFELAEQIPDATHVYVPAGTGGLLVAIARGLTRRGLAPALIACQPAGCAPIARYVNGDLHLPTTGHCATRISALQRPEPIDGVAAGDAVIDSGGWGTPVTDQAIYTAQRRLVAAEELLVEPAAATSLAAFMTDIAAGRISRDARPVLVLTGAGWHNLARTYHAHYDPETDEISPSDE